MTRSSNFLAGSLALVGLSVLVAKPLLPPTAWLGLSMAAVSALAVQGLLFLALSGVRKDPKRFATGVLVGAATRLAVLVLAIALLALSPRPWAVPFLLGLTGYLVALLWFESLLEHVDLLRPRAAKR